MPMTGKTPRESRVEMAEHVLPNDTNPHGTIFGGRVMALVDLAATIAASRHSRRAVVTAAIDELRFLAPIKLGHIVLLEAQVNEAFSTSMEIGVTVSSENPITGERRLTTTAYATFVALDDLGKPTAVPPLLAETEDELARQQAARQRKQDRLERRAQAGRD
ncbi:MAG: acyl-CoA thioesterase [Candidatus Sericytochromatia bacterium]|nr:acyl-CoA thioesterase [Candidatus Sericytochromatia bacterium]